MTVLGAIVSLLVGGLGISGACSAFGIWNGLRLRREGGDVSLEATNETIRSASPEGRRFVTFMAVVVLPSSFVLQTLLLIVTAPYRAFLTHRDQWRAAFGPPPQPPGPCEDPSCERCQSNRAEILRLLLLHRAARDVLTAGAADGNALACAREIVDMTARLDQQARRDPRLSDVVRVVDGLPATADGGLSADVQPGQG